MEHESEPQSEKPPRSRDGKGCSDGTGGRSSPVYKMHLRPKDNCGNSRAEAIPVDVYVEEKTILIQNMHTQIIHREHDRG